MDTDKIKIYGAKVKVDSMEKTAQIEEAEKLKMRAKCEKILAHRDKTGAPMNVRARPGRLSGLSVPWRFPMKIHFVWGFCMGAQGA